MGIISGLNQTMYNQSIHCHSYKYNLCYFWEAMQRPSIWDHLSTIYHSFTKFNRINHHQDSKGDVNPLTH